MNEKLKKELKKLNYKSSYKIKYRKQKDGYSLYLEIQRKNLRETINLKGYILSDIASTVQKDKQILQKANEEKSKYNERYELNGNNVLLQNKLRESNVIDFYNALRSKKSGNTLKSWNNAYKHFQRFTKGYIKFSDITLQFCENYREYLLSEVSENTACTYYANFKTLLNNAVKKGIIQSNIASYVENPKPTPKREFLTINEIEKLSNSEYFLPDIQNAFLFSCFTGLRISDIKKLRWDNINEGYLEIEQEKTDELLRLKLSETANNILNKQHQDSELVFDLPGEVAINRHLEKWLKENGITKKITFHCARHTFATMCLTYDIDIYTVSKLLGHTDIKHTQIYAKLIDKKRDAAIDKLPTF